MKRASYVVCASVILLFAFAQSASADASCGVFVEGSVSDVFGNTVWSGSSLVDAGIQPDAGTCSTAAYNALNSHAYSICAQRSSGVNIDISGGVYFNGQLVQEHEGPSSCVGGLWSQLLQRAWFRSGTEPGRRHHLSERLVHAHLSSRWQHRGVSGLNGCLGRQLLVNLQQLGGRWSGENAGRRQLRRGQLQRWHGLDVGHRQFGRLPRPPRRWPNSHLCHERQSALVECLRPFLTAGRGQASGIGTPLIPVLRCHDGRHEDREDTCLFFFVLIVVFVPS